MYKDYLFSSPTPNEGREYYKRPLEVKSLIDAEFSKIFLKPLNSTGYIYVGSEKYVYDLGECLLDTEIVIKDKIKKNKSDKPLEILNVGAGNFSFKKFYDENHKGKVNVYGITAHSLPSETIPDEHKNEYVFENAEYLSSHFEKNKFDLIISNATYSHFVDSIASLMEAYLTLKVGGILLIDRIGVRGCTVSGVKAAISQLASEGYDVFVDNIFSEESRTKESRTYIGNIIIRKTEKHPTLNFPLLFDRIKDNEVYYTPSPHLKFSNNNYFNMKDNYEKGKQLLQSIFNNKITKEHHLGECKNLFQLLAHEEYQKLSLGEKNLFILKIVADTVSLDLYSGLFDILSGLRSSYNLLGRLNQKTHFYSLFILHEYLYKSGNTSEFSADIQEKLIIIRSVHILTRSRFLQCENELNEKFDLKTKASFDNSNKLSFPTIVSDEEQELSYKVRPY